VGGADRKPEIICQQNGSPMVVSSRIKFYSSVTPGTLSRAFEMAHEPKAHGRFGEEAKSVAKLGLESPFGKISPCK
jgi:hypothetical protein